MSPPAYHSLSWWIKAYASALWDHLFNVIRLSADPWKRKLFSDNPNSKENSGCPAGQKISGLTRKRPSTRTRLSGLDWACNKLDHSVTNVCRCCAFYFAVQLYFWLFIFNTAQATGLSVKDVIITLKIAQVSCYSEDCCLDMLFSHHGWQLMSADTQIRQTPWISSWWLPQRISRIFSKLKIVWRQNTESLAS